MPSLHLIPSLCVQLISTHLTGGFCWFYSMQKSVINSLTVAVHLPLLLIAWCISVYHSWQWADFTSALMRKECLFRWIHQWFMNHALLVVIIHTTNDFIAFFILFVYDHKRISFVTTAKKGKHAAFCVDLRALMHNSYEDDLTSIWTCDPS